MKLARFFLLAFTSLSLTSCLEINELVEIFDNGSGQLSVSTDMSQMLDMMQAMGGEDFEKRKDDKIDSTIQLKDMVDANKELTDAEKKLVRDGKMHMKVNLEEKKFVLKSSFPFSNLSSLQEIKTKGLDTKVSFSTTDKVMGTDAKEEEGGKDKDKPDMAVFLGAFDHVYENGTIKRTVNKAKLAKMKGDEKLAQMKTASEMGIKVTYKVDYKLPSPSKKVTGSNAKVSADGKTVTVTNDLLDLLNHPEKFEFTISY